MAQIISSIIPAFDQLLLVCQGLDVINSLQVEVFDSVISGANLPANMIVVGGLEPESVVGQQVAAGAAAQHPPRDENFEINLSIVGFIGSGRSQMAVRDDCHSILTSLLTALEVNYTLNGSVLWAQASDITLSQTTAVESLEGRFCTVDVVVHCWMRNSYA